MCRKNAVILPKSNIILMVKMQQKATRFSSENPLEKSCSQLVHKLDTHFQQVIHHGYVPHSTIFGGFGGIRAQNIDKIACNQQKIHKLTMPNTSTT